jgi:hypothetical protein
MFVIRNNNEVVDKNIRGPQVIDEIVEQWFRQQKLYGNCRETTITTSCQIFGIHTGIPGVKQ